MKKHLDKAALAKDRNEEMAYLAELAGVSVRELERSMNEPDHWMLPGLRVEPLRANSRCIRVFGAGFVAYVLAAEEPGEADPEIVRRRVEQIDADLAVLGRDYRDGIRGIALTQERRGCIAALAYLEHERGDDLPHADMRGFRWLGEDDDDIDPDALPFDGSSAPRDTREPESVSELDRDSAGYGW